MTSKHNIPEALRQQVRLRAQSRCEYCRMHEDDVFMPHEADHILSEKHGGPTHINNLAWSCSACNRFKGSDIGSLNPTSARFVHFYNPRKHKWPQIFVSQAHLSNP